MILLSLHATMQTREMFFLIYEGVSSFEIRAYGYVLSLYPLFPSPLEYIDRSTLT